MPPEAQNELDIITARYTLAKDCSIVEVKSGGSVSYQEVLGSIEHFLNTTENDGGKFLITLYVIMYNAKKLRLQVIAQLCVGISE